MATSSLDFEYDVFLSYSSADGAEVRVLAEMLKKDGLNVWLDQWIVQPGDSIPQCIESGLAASRILILVMSRNSFSSDWVALERHTSLFRDPTNRRRRFVPLRLDDSEIKDTLKQFAYIDWRRQDPQEYHRLLKHCESARVVQDDSPRLATVPPKYELSTLAQFAHEAKQIHSAAAVRDAMQRSLRALESLHFEAAMISLIFEDASQHWIVSQLAYGHCWASDASRQSRRELNGSDVLAVVVRTRSAKYVPDSQLDPTCDLLAVKDFGLISFYAMPLFGPFNEVIGVLQVDMGDRHADTELPYELTSILDAIGIMTSASISKALLTEEVTMQRDFDDVANALPAVVEPKGSLMQLVQLMHKVLDLESVHLHFYNAILDRLERFVTVGLAFEHEAILPREYFRPSPVLWCSLDEMHVMNDHSFAHYFDLPTQVEAIESLRLFPRMRSHTTIRLRNQESSIGTLHLEFRNSWTFTPSKLRSIQNMIKTMTPVINRAYDHFVAESVCCKLFIVSARSDVRWRDGLVEQLGGLVAKRVLSITHDGSISPGLERTAEVNKFIDEADIIVLLVSPEVNDTNSSCEMNIERALARQRRNEVRIIPVLLKPVQWDIVPFAHLQSLPLNGRPLTLWRRQSEAYHVIVNGIAEVAKETAQKRTTTRSCEPVLDVSRDISDASAGIAE